MVFDCCGKKEKSRKIREKLDELLKDTQGDHAYGDRPRKNPLDDALLRKIWGLKGRQRLVKELNLDWIHGEQLSNFGDEQEEAEEDKPLLEGGLFAGQDYYDLRQKCLDSGSLFVDPMFPPCQVSIYGASDTSGDAPQIEWVRAKDLATDPRMFVEGPTRFDVNQGTLGDCWMLAAMANLTLVDELLHKVVPDDQGFYADQDNYAGIFHFRIWQYGEWIDVVVDDYLPTVNGELIYICSKDKNEFWTALLEKAYAKIHGSYKSLEGGSVADAMVDFSGGCSERYELNDKSRWMEIYQAMQNGWEGKPRSLISCHLKPDPEVLEAKTSTGLVRGHAYSVTKVVRAKVDTGNRKGEFPLVRVRNPWGEKEWKGTWSDGSAVWQFVPEGEKERIGLDFDDQDGEFYMSQMDFMGNFEYVEICNMAPVDGVKAWSVECAHGSWVKGVNAGGSRNELESFATNSQYLMTLSSPDGDSNNKSKKKTDKNCTLVVSLIQKGTRQRKAVTDGNGCLVIGFIIYAYKDLKKDGKPLPADHFRFNLSVGRSGTFVNSREVSARFKLPPGKYVVIPSTYNAGEEGDYLLRVFTEKAADLKLIAD